MQFDNDNCEHKNGRRELNMPIEGVTICEDCRQIIIDKTRHECTWVNAEEFLNEDQARGNTLMCKHCGTLSG